MEAKGGKQSGGNVTQALKKRPFPRSTYFLCSSLKARLKILRIPENPQRFGSPVRGGAGGWLQSAGALRKHTRNRVMRCYDQDKICMKRPVLLTLLILVFPMLALAADEHWELTESPIIIILTSTFTVAAGDTLRIDPGVEVRCPRLGGRLQRRGADPCFRHCGPARQICQGDGRHGVAEDRAERQCRGHFYEVRALTVRAISPRKHLARDGTAFPATCARCFLIACP